MSYTVTNQWPGGFQADVSVRNTSEEAISGWSLDWTFADDQQVSQSWNATVSRSGTTITATNAGWNGVVAVGGSASFGFLGAINGTANASPTGFTLNGRTCTIT